MNDSVRWMCAWPLALLAACGGDSDSATPAPSGGAGASGAGGGSAGAGGGVAAGAAGAAGSAPAYKGVQVGKGASCSEEMFCKYGEAAFLKVNDLIIAKATASGIEANIGDTFTKLTPEKAAVFKANLGTFLINAYGGDKAAYKYQGSDMKTAHAGLGITQAQYSAFVSMVIVPALTEAGVAGDDITNCFAPPITSDAFMKDIVTK